MQCRSQLFGALLAATGLLAFGACDTFDGDQAPPAAGYYETRGLTVLTDTGAVDALARGTFIEMRLQPDNTVKEGVLFVSAEFTEEDTEGSRRIEFSGTWSHQSDSTVTFEHEADTFIRDTPWHYENDTLRANNGEVEAVLVRQGESSS